MLKQMLLNLLSNAVKFTPEGGEIVLHAGMADLGPGDCIEISVSDTGIGIQAEEMKRIFEPFEQADNSSQRRFQGTGLGLSLTQDLVRLHGGQLWAESSGEGRGSKFVLRLPCRQDPN